MGAVVSAFSGLKLLWTTIAGLNRDFDRVKARVEAAPGFPNSIPQPTTSEWQPAAGHKFDTLGRPLPTSVDILIIGSGVTACAIAKTILHDFVAESIGKDGKSLSIAIVDAREICSGATGRNGGHIKESAYLEYSVLLKRKKSPEVAKAITRFRMDHRKRLKEVADEMKVTDKCEIRDVDSVDVFFADEAWDEARKDLRVFQEAFPDEASKFTELDNDLAVKKYGLKGIRGVIEGTAGALSPYLFTTSIFSRLLQATPSLSIHPNTVVTDVRRRRGFYDVTISSPSEDLRPVARRCTSTSMLSKVESKVTKTATRTALSACCPSTMESPTSDFPSTGRTIRATTVIHATNAYVSNLLPELRSKIIPVRGQMTSVRPQAPQGDVRKSPLSPGRSWSFIYDKGFDYLITRQSGDVMLGGGWAQGSGGGLDDVGIASDAENSLLSSSHLLGLLPAIFDDTVLKGVEVKGVWSGAIGMSVDLLPWVGETPESISNRKGNESDRKGNDSDRKGNDSKGEWVCAGFSGEGMVNAWGCGEALAKQIVERHTNKKLLAVDQHLVIPEDMKITKKRLEKASLTDLAEAWD
ncbi:hypothetical protein JAAARDRAFT_60464 [Jaapia argillacea MUCL 33604]|uniref:FAD dependent oxidoreductase domain-containing protein n=1 Tax=Jaapia argillacea MUCL 33604 TaxID=933084 RepID=A0A067PKV9_9AGAM|nr:hypothetical protein JAAARDRAFT_60464 [Jaapia argillacea MUCL 33604]